MIYADYNATAPLRPEAREAMLAAFEIGANPSSVHGAGRAARKAVERARAQVGAAIGAAAENIIFTSGGTEANQLALHGSVAAIDTNDGAATQLISNIEHEAVTQNAATAGARLYGIEVTEDGVIDLDDLREHLVAMKPEEYGTPILSLMLVNNETGVIQPVAEAAAMVREFGGLIHCDAVQALGKIPVNAALLGVDYHALSAQDRQ